MLLNLAYIAAGLGLLSLGAEALVRGATSFALRAGLTPLVVGLTIVAMATGSPELFVSAKSAITGDAGLALGNVIGSNISNLALVLGVAAVVAPMAVRSELVRREMPLMLAASSLLVALLLDGELSRLDGAILLFCEIAYVAFAYINARREATDEAADEYRADLELLASRGREILFMVAGVGLLVGGADLLTRGAVALASQLGVTSAVIALTVVAVGTSLPELATSISAARAGQADVAFGNVIGSNVFNILGVLGLVSFIHPIVVQGIRPIDYWMLIGAAVLVLLLMLRGWVLNRWEGLLLLAAYTAYVATLIT